MRLVTKFIAAVACVVVVGSARADQGIEDAARAPFMSALAGKRIVFVPTSMGYDLTEGWAAALKKEFEPFGAKFEIRDPNWSTSAGAQAITSLINEKPDIILVQNPDLNSYAKLLRQAQEANIYVVQVNMKSNTTTDAFVGADWVGYGEIMAETIVKQCGKGSGKSGEVAIVQGVLTSASSAYQLRGVDHVLSKHPEIKVVSNQAADWDASKARNITSTVVRQYPNLCGIIGFWDGHDIGTAAALREAKMNDKVFLVTSGGGTRAASCDNVVNGNFDMVVSYDVPGQARDLANVFKILLHSKPKVGTLKAVLYTTPKLITKSTIGPDSCWDLVMAKK